MMPALSTAPTTTPSAMRRRGRPGPSSPALPPSVVIVCGGWTGASVDATVATGADWRRLPISANALAISPIERARWSGALASRRTSSVSSEAGTSPRTVLSFGGGSLRWRVYASGIVRHTNGGRPAASSNATQPSEYTSARQSTFDESPHCSGAMYVGVPMVPDVFGELLASVPDSFAMPKSRILTRSPVGRSSSLTR